MRKSFQADSRRVACSGRRVNAGLRSGLLTLAIACASLLHSSIAAALGLGDITLHSAMGQPLNADIELIQTEGLNPEDIVVGLASSEAFSKAGIERAFFYNDLRFTPIIRGNRGVVHIESRKAVTEPYLSFLVRLVRPSGDQLHEYTLLLDPPDSPAGLSATRSRTTTLAGSTPTSTESRMPVAPPAAVEGKHYTVAVGDSLASIAKSVQAPGGKVSTADLAKGIQALNPQAFPGGERNRLQVGQSLLLPDAAVAPAQQPAPTSSGAVTPGDNTPKVAEQLTATALENQQLTKSVGDLKGQVQVVEEEVADKNKQITELQTRLAELKATPTAPAPVATPAVAPTHAAPAPVEPVDDSSDLPWPLLLGAVLILLLLLGLAYSVRRNRIKNEMALESEPLIKPVQSAVTPVFEVPAVAPKPSAASTPVSTAFSGSRLAGVSTDALDGASIYIAYGRFTEALAILREALQKQPQRTDLRLRILELLGEQGDLVGFDEEEKVLLNQGIEPQKLQDIRSRYPQLSVSAQPASVAPAPAAVISPAAPLVAPVVAAAVISSVTPPAKASPELDENAAATLNLQPEDDFHLNLDDLSMDSDWDLVDPFESTPAPRKPVPQAPQAMDPNFASDLTQLPEVFEMPDEQFLSDFAEPVPDVDPDFDLDMDIDLDADLGMDLEADPISDPIVPSNSDSLDDAFLDGFMDDESQFDLLDLEEEPLSKINQAQVLIDEGNTDEARQLLQEIIDRSDDGSQQTARDLLAGIS
ncbi:MAG TPA: FimV/HubP family polar landmark protein [Pseudomonas sp.]|uniref:FimV/HubP family polar landmark protein n=1 Tax=Pseudomonas sp. TaxID=306 RepID=UPI002ED86449